MTGQTIGNYKILEKLSEGEMVAVYKAVDTVLTRDVLIKVLRQDFSSQSSISERFRSEATTLAKLSHPLIPNLHTCFAKDGRLFMVLEYLNGETLDRILQRRETLSCKEAVPLFIQALDCLEYAHSSGVIHGSLKPSNLMLTDKGTLKILGFGVAHSLGTAEPAADAFERVTAAERTNREDDGLRSDVFALGATLYETLTGKAPFNAENKSGQKELPLQRRPSEINSEIPRLVEAVIMKALAEKPDERFQTAAEFRRALVETDFNGSVFKTPAENEVSGKPGWPAATAWQPVKLEPSIWQDAFEEPAFESTERPAEIVSKKKRAWVASLDFSEVAAKIKERKFNQKKMPFQKPAAGTGRSYNRTSLAGAAISAIIILHFVSQVTFFKSEKIVTKTGAINEQIVELQPGAETKPRNEQTAKVQTERPAKRQADIVTLPKTARVAPPATAAKPQAEQAEPEMAPSRTIIKKKEAARQSRAERLRRAEKLLTGV